MKIDPEYRRAIEAVLQAAGATLIEYRQGGVHPRVVYRRADGVERFSVLPGTPGDSRRGIKMKVAELRRDLGITGAKPKSAHAPKRRAHIEVPTTMPRMSARPDPFAALAEWRPAAPQVPPRWVWTPTGGRMWRVERA